MFWSSSAWRLLSVVAWAGLQDVLYLDFGVLTDCAVGRYWTVYSSRQKERRQYSKFHVEYS